MADVTHAADVERMVDSAIQRYGRLDVLHNNVADRWSGARRGYDRRGLGPHHVNLKSMMWCCKFSIPRMRRSGGGSIINVSSVAGAIGVHDPSKASPHILPRKPV